MDSGTLWWTAVGANWLTLCQECRREVFWALYYFPHILELLSILEKKLICNYADDYTLMAVVPSLGFRVTVEESIRRDLVKVSGR